MVKGFIKSIYQFLYLFGFDFAKTVRSIKGVPWYIKNYIDFRRQRPKCDNNFHFGRLYPCFEDSSAESVQLTGHYFYQDLLIASRIFSNQPERHVDVGSRVDGFVAHVASFREIVVVDIRPLHTSIGNIEFFQADLMNQLPSELVRCCDSLSCLHAMEHFGLGRYGDPLRWNGHQVGLRNLLKMLKQGGKLYISVPIGLPRIEFNAHRVFSISYLIQMFSDKLRIDDFSFVDDKGKLFQDVVLDNNNIDTNCGCSYGCGIFEMTKL